MRVLGQICLLAAFVCSGYAAFACIAGGLRNRRGLLRIGTWSAFASLAGLTGTLVILAVALLAKDFQFAYVAHYSSRQLPWYYSLSALWVGQAGSLLLWAWILGLLGVAMLLTCKSQGSQLRHCAFGLVMAYVSFLAATMVFGADPMQANLSPGDEGLGLSPLLQHPAMLIHPPIVFLGYAAWTAPFALAISSMLTGSSGRQSEIAANGNGQLADRRRGESSITDSPNTCASGEWIRPARNWALFAWAVLGTGILLGAQWSYEELGWGGYWGWDPVENGSLIPWLTGTAFLHGLIAWQFVGNFKKTTLTLAIVTFGMCNFATFLTRSGIFSSLHAFSQSPIGWLFLGLMIVLGTGGGYLIVHRRSTLTAEKQMAAVLSREVMIVISAVVLLLLAAVTVIGTLSVALSDAVLGRRIVVGPAFYNNVLIPVGLVLLGTLALAPLLRWGRPPAAGQQRALLTAALCGCAALAVAWITGVRHPLALAVSGLAGLAVSALLGAFTLDAMRLHPERPWAGIVAVIAAKRRQYAGFVIHMGFICLAVGVTGSSLGARRHEFVMEPGQTVQWAGRSIRFVGLQQHERPDRFVAEAELEVSTGDSPAVSLRPAQHLHRLQDEWTTEVAIDSTWAGDFYTILHNGEAGEAVRLTLVENPLMRWLWLGGLVMGLGAVGALWPARSKTSLRTAPLSRPQFLKRQERTDHSKTKSAVH